MGGLDGTVDSLYVLQQLQTSARRAESGIAAAHHLHAVTLKRAKLQIPVSFSKRGDWG
jgi:hypothetical protein